MSSSTNPFLNYEFFCWCCGRFVQTDDRAAHRRYCLPGIREEAAVD